MNAVSALAQIRRQPSLAYYYAQKAVRSQRLRNTLGSAVASMVKQPDSATQVAGAAQVAAELEQAGICFLPQLQMPTDDLEAVRRHLEGKPLVDWYDSSRSIDIVSGVPAECTKLSHRASDLIDCEPLVRLANSPLVLQAVTSVLGAKPTISWFESWWTFGEHHVPGKTHFDDIYHRDVDDLRFVKLFAYLTDTGVSNGAHSFVRGSHRSHLLTRRGPITDQDVHNNFPAGDILTITGNAGTVFLENTWGIHRPLLATEGRRQIFSVLYALTPWVPRNATYLATSKMPQGLDPYVNRVLYRDT